MFKPLNLRAVVSMHNRVNDTLQIAGKTFILDSIFRPLWNAVQFGTVVACDPKCDVEPGDKVYMHHFVMEKEHIVPVEGDKFSWVEYNQIYCRVREDKIKMLGEYLLVEPMKYSHPSMKNDVGGFRTTMKSDNDEVERIGIAAHLSDSCVRDGLEAGDIILFGKNCEYEIMVEGKKYYRMHKADVITVLSPDLKISSIR